MSVVVTHWSIKSFWYPAVTERYRWYDGRWHFNICLPSREWHQTGPLLVSISALCDTLELLLHCLKKVLLCDWTQAARVFLLLYPTRQIVAFPMFFFPLHLSSRNTDDPEVSLQLQCQLHWPPHLSVHALTSEDGAGTPEPPAGQPRGHRNQHGYMHGCEFSGKIWGGAVIKGSHILDTH